MMWSFGPWELAILLSKVLSYISLASLSGGIFVLWLMGRLSPVEPQLAVVPENIWPLAARRRIVVVLFSASIIGTLSSTLFFLLQIGLINQSGLAGMFDSMMFGLIAKTNVGDGVGLKLLGFVVAGLALFIARKDLLRPAGVTRIPAGLIAGALASTTLFAVSFAVVGHVAGLNALAHVAVALHIAAIGLWLGAFYPLHTLCRSAQQMDSTTGASLQRLMQVFGQFGWGITGVLLIAGAYLMVQVFADFETFFGSIYGRLLTLKIVLVLCLLALAAMNKFRLVGKLPNSGFAPLRKSIAGEMTLAFVVLLLTAMLTTFTGPAHLM